MPKNNPPSRARSRTAGLFDLRFLIAVLFGTYGVVLTVMGALGPTAAELQKSGGWNVNLWCGVVTLGVAVLFSGWALIRPLQLPEQAPDMETDEQPESQPA